tara:strand:- start:191 stop:463 length:273 start_codon:yes stop_codon:yes gene_type:complete
MHRKEVKIMKTNNHKAKYRIGDLVLIDKIFSTENNANGTMEKLDKPVLASVEKVTYTSMGPNYNLKLFDNSDISLKVCYWESDILSSFDL